ncbi:flagellar assembly protein FliX [Acidiphilium sp. PA]|uniref:flagellar assembly protein FliX n=1 Tax=Acidiphilium sp. PA TaxID=2871705 RepID=UPI002243DAD0|nr:flagellar assembly protein FliX [Acidiphilium sp. PA]MCW8307552.1 flagellar assembly protein FliX [Acidiphilium sp. PA]
MTRISALSGVGAARPGGTTARTGAPGFMLRQPAAASVGTVSAVIPAGLIALQEDTCPQHRDRTARRGGESVLGALDAIQIATLNGDGGAALAALSDAVATMTEPADPVLRQIIGAIRLRAKVELARRDQI